MTPGRLVLLRLFNITLGRWAFFSHLLRKALVALLIKGQKTRYVQSSLYFGWEELEQD